MRGFYIDTVTRHRAPAGTNIHGDLDWAAATATTLTGVRVQPTGEGKHRLLAARDIDLVHTDRVSRVLASGALEWFEVIGSPQRFRSPYGSADHSETELGGIANG